MSRILHVSDVFRPAVGGIEVFVGDLAARQYASGHDVTVLTSTRGDRPEPAGFPRVVRAERGPGAVAAGRRVAREQYDVVHAHLSVFSPFSTLVARGAALAGVPTVLTMHSMVGDRRWILRTVGRGVGWDRWPAVWTTVSEAAAADLKEVLPPHASVSVVPNAVDVSWWTPGEHRVQCEEGRPVTVLSVMRLVPRKRPLALVSMLASMRAQMDRDTRLAAWIVGDGPLLDRMRGELERRGLGDWVTLTGGLDRAAIRERCHQADLYVAPATRESFGIAALEARAAGLPVIAMRGGGVRDFVRDGVEGVLADGDPEMGRAMAALAVDDAGRGRIAAYNRAVPPTADWPLVVDDFDRVYAAAYDLARSARLRPRVAWRAAASQ